MHLQVAGQKSLRNLHWQLHRHIGQITRQVELIESGGTVVQETRLFDPDKGVTRSMRSKEDAHDYRYFPDPDLLPLVLSDEFVAECKASLPELPDAKRARYDTPVFLLFASLLQPLERTLVIAIAVALTLRHRRAPSLTRSPAAGIV